MTFAGTAGNDDGERAGRGEQQSLPVSAVLAFYQAMRESNLPDVLALADPEVFYQPMDIDPSRPEVYRGHEGMVRLVQDVHATYGDYQIKFVEVAEEPGPQVTVQAWVVPESGRGLQFPMRLTFALRDGRITSIQSLP